MKLIKQGIESIEIDRSPTFAKSKDFMDKFMKGNINTEEKIKDTDFSNSSENNSATERRVVIHSTQDHYNTHPYQPVQSSIASILGLEHTDEQVSFILLESDSFTVDVTAIGYTCNADSIAILLPKGVKINCPKLVQFTVKLAGKLYNVVYPGNSLHMAAGQLLQLLIVN